MSRPYLMAAFIAALLLLYPAWLEGTGSTCAALSDRIAKTDNTEALHPSPYWNSSGVAGAPGELLRDAEGVLSGAAFARYLPSLPPAISCAIGYWHVLLVPNLAEHLASAH